MSLVLRLTLLTNSFHLPSLILEMFQKPKCVVYMQWLLFILRESFASELMVDRTLTLRALTRTDPAALQPTKPHWPGWKFYLFVVTAPLYQYLLSVKLNAMIIFLNVLILIPMILWHLNPSSTSSIKSHLLWFWEYNKLGHTGQTKWPLLFGIRSVYIT